MFVGDFIFEGSIGRVDLVSAIGIKDYNLVKKLKENIEREGGSNEEK